MLNATSSEVKFIINSRMTVAILETGVKGQLSPRERPATCRRHRAILGQRNCPLVAPTLQLARRTAWPNSWWLTLEVEEEIGGQLIERKGKKPLRILIPLHLASSAGEASLTWHTPHQSLHWKDFSCLLRLRQWRGLFSSKWILEGLFYMHWLPYLTFRE